MRVLEFGDEHNPSVVVCVHGLTRSAFDFLPLASHLSHRYRVLCPHIVGRGDSDWLDDPSHYHLGQYAQDMQSLFSQIGLSSAHWVGTSMGGLIALTILGHPQRQALFGSVAIRSLVLNDVGAVISGKALARIGQYVGQQPVFERFGEATAAARQLFASFGPHNEAQWELLAASVVRPLEWHTARSDWKMIGRQKPVGGRRAWTPDPGCFPRSEADLRAMAAIQGAFRFHYDPDIAEPFRLAHAAGQAEIPDLVLWPLYDAITCPTLVVRGVDSDLLSAQTAADMQHRGPRARLLEVADTGHAPSLLPATQIEAVAAFISASEETLT
ncbi:MAG: Poly(3-hydroxybutyrate) depolymerase [Pseudomonadota bacterium]